MTSSTTQSQKDILLEFMKKYPSMATNCPATNSSGRDNTNKHWEELTELLNTNGPPIKTLKAWKKTWADYKHRAKSKLAKNKVFLYKTGGGPFEEKKLSAFEEATIELGKLEAAVAGIDGAKSFCGEPRQ